MSDALTAIFGVLSIMALGTLVSYICVMLLVSTQKEKSLEVKDEVEKTEDGTAIWCEVRLPLPKRSSKEIEELFKAGKLQFDLIVTPWGYRYLSMSLKPEVKE